MGNEVNMTRWFQLAELNGPEVGQFAKETFKSIGWI